jgi:hypothetical protein
VLVGAEGVLDDSLEVSGRVQAIGEARGRQLEGAGEEGDVETHAALKGLLHEARTHFDRVGQGAAIDVMILWRSRRLARVSIRACTKLQPATPPTYSNAKRDFDEPLQRNGQVDAVLDALHQHQRADAVCASAVDAHDTHARCRRMHLDSYGGWWRVPTEEAVVDLEGPRIVFAAIHRYDYAILADVVPAWQGVLQSPSHAAETRVVARDAGPPALKSREVACVDAGRRSAC